MRSGLLALTFLAASLFACAHPSYGDAGADAQPPEPRNFDVDPSGTAVCPGQLLYYASYGRATCSRAPQQCVSATDASTAPNCFCTGADGGQGTWSCR
jgi:hypothetical protein